MQHSNTSEDQIQYKSKRSQKYTPDKYQIKSLSRFTKLLSKQSRKSNYFIELNRHLPVIV